MSGRMPKEACVLKVLLKSIIESEKQLVSVSYHKHESMQQEQHKIDILFEELADHG